jgi:hypothetical protein
MGGKVFWADVYRVLRAFGVTCPAVQHAVKKLLMPGQRGAKDKLQDLEEALWSVSEAIDMARAELPECGTLTGETEPEPVAEPEPEPKPKMVTWRLCVQINTRQIYGKKPWAAFVEWWPSGDIPEDWYPIEAHTQPVETVKQLPEGQRP